MYYVEVIWRYAQGHRSTAIHQTRVRAVSVEAAEEWGKEAVKRKFTNAEIEIVKSTAMHESD